MISPFGVMLTHILAQARRSINRCIRSCNGSGDALFLVTENLWIPKFFFEVDDLLLR